MPTSTTHLALLLRDTPSRPAENQSPQKHSNSGAIVAGVVVVVLLILLCVGLFYAYKFWRARKLGLPPPSLNPFASQSAVATRNYPARGGVIGWVKSKFKGVKNKRTAGGAYESGRGARGRGFGPLDQDEGGAWDTRMHDGDEEELGYGGGRGYYEEQELSLTSHHARGVSDASDMDGDFENAETGYHAPRGLEPEMPKSGSGHSRGLSQYDTGTAGSHSDPFGDSAERSTMGRPSTGQYPPHLDTKAPGGHRHGQRGSKDDDSPTERRSIFHEEM